MGMWQVEQMSSMSARDSGWSIDSRRTLPCQYGSREEFAIIPERQSNPMEISSPEDVLRPLWHARQRSEVSNFRSSPGCCALISAGTVIMRPARSNKHHTRFDITNLQSIYRLANPRECKTSVGPVFPTYCSPECERPGSPLCAGAC